MDKVGVVNAKVQHKEDDPFAQLTDEAMMEVTILFL
jgi:hypothetical protein